MRCHIRWADEFHESITNSIDDDDNIDCEKKKLVVVVVVVVVIVGEVVVVVVSLFSKFLQSIQSITHVTLLPSDEPFNPTTQTRKAAWRHESRRVTYRREDTAWRRVGSLPHPPEGVIDNKARRRTKGCCGPSLRHWRVGGGCGRHTYTFLSEMFVPPRLSGTGSPLKGGDGGELAKDASVRLVWAGGNDGVQEWGDANTEEWSQWSQWSNWGNGDKVKDSS